MCRGDVKEYLASQHPEELQAAPPSAMDTDSAPSGQDIAMAMVELLEDNTRLRQVLRTMRDGVYQNLHLATVCDVCGDTWYWEDAAGSYCGQCGDSFCASCTEQYVTHPADKDAEPCCAICESNGTVRPYTPWTTLL